METKHTPGPWIPRDSIEAGGIIHYAITADQSFDWMICSVTPMNLKRDQDIANARLIAAAPDLLEACKAAKKHLEPDLVEPGRTVFWKLVEAIRKATGGAQ